MITPSCSCFVPVFKPLPGLCAGETLKIELQAKDTYGNNVKTPDSSDPSHFTVRFSNGLTTDFTSENDEGRYSVQYQIEQQGLYSLEILYYNGSVPTPIKGSLAWTLQFTFSPKVA